MLTLHKAPITYGQSKFCWKVEFINQLRYGLSVYQTDNYQIDKVNSLLFDGFLFKLVKKIGYFNLNNKIVDKKIFTFPLF
jgi:hypothetical protein